jgi:hypothetical protein
VNSLNAGEFQVDVVVIQTVSQRSGIKALHQTLHVLFGKMNCSAHNVLLSWPGSASVWKTKEPMLSVKLKTLALGSGLKNYFSNAAKKSSSAVFVR